jgi:energy-coupling factor transporter ATP-binding protein EcfA2
MGGPVALGPTMRRQMLRLGKMWKQGEHVLVTGATGSGKTQLASQILNERDRRGAHIIVLCFKTRRDDTIENLYLKRGYTKYTSWPKRDFPSWERKVVLWPDVRPARGNTRDIIAIQKEAMTRAFGRIMDQGNRTVLFDDGLYFVHPQFLNMGPELAMFHAMGRSDQLTGLTLAQRPSNLPLLVYGSADHAMVGMVRELSDQKRLAALQAEESAKELEQKIAGQGKHDFLWIPARHGGPAEPMNYAA